jgi:hypothetical protein
MEGQRRIMRVWIGQQDRLERVPFVLPSLQEVSAAQACDGVRGTRIDSLNSRGLD